MLSIGEDAFSVRLLKTLNNPERALEETLGASADEITIILALAVNASGYTDVRSLAATAKNAQITTSYEDAEEAVEDGFTVIDLSGNRWGII